MPRYILIDTNSGYIFGDTADFAAGRQSDIQHISDAAKMLDESLGVHGRAYVEHNSNPHESVAGYDVYRADINGSDAVPVVLDGQDQATIDAVIGSCEYAGFVECCNNQMTNADDYRIEDIQEAIVNGRNCILFKAYKKQGDAFIFAGQHTAPARTAQRDLWKIADQA